MTLVGTLVCHPGPAAIARPADPRRRPVTRPGLRPGRGPGVRESGRRDGGEQHVTALDQDRRADKHTPRQEPIMTNTLTYQHMGTTARGQTHALFAQTMGYVALTAALFALGARAGRNLTGGIGIVAFIAAFACLIGMRFAAKRSTELTVG